ncbi:MAG: RNA polymerase sigma factor [bacterium]
MKFTEIQFTDEELVGRVCGGEQELYGEVIRRYEDKLRRYVGYLVSDPGFDGEGVVQNILLKGFVNLRGFDVRKSFSSWIYRIAHNEVMNAVKHAKLRQSDDLALFSDVLKGQEDTAKEVEDTMVREQIEGCLSAIPLQYREVVVFFYFEQYTYDQISDILHIPVQTVGTLLHRGKKLLKSVCERKGVRP